ncbi:MAG: hypothetical protein V1493_01315 [Candidatus Diapherotrites archaeon]
MQSGKKAVKAAIVLALLSLLFLQVVAQGEVRAIQVKIDGLKYQRHETVTIAALFDKKPVADANVEMRFQRFESRPVEGDANKVILQVISHLMTDKEGKFSVSLHEAGTYFFQFFKQDGEVIYTAKEKIDYLIDPRLRFEASQGIYTLCFVEPVGSAIITEGEAKTTKVLDEKNCTDYYPKTGLFSVGTPYSKEFRQIEIPIEVQAETPEPKPTPSITPSQPQPTPTPTPKEAPGPDYLLIGAISLVAAVLVGAGLYFRKRRQSL